MSLNENHHSLTPHFMKVITLNDFCTIYNYFFRNKRSKFQIINFLILYFQISQIRIIKNHEKSTKPTIIKNYEKSSKHQQLNNDILTSFVLFILSVSFGQSPSSSSSAVLTQSFIFWNTCPLSLVWNMNLHYSYHIFKAFLIIFVLSIKGEVVKKLCLSHGYEVLTAAIFL